MKDYTIDFIEINDFDHIYAIEQRAYPLCWKRDVMIDAFNAHYLKLKLVNPQQIIGYAFVSFVLDEAHLLNITIDPDWQRRGLGGFLLKSIMDNHIPKTIHTFFLEVRESNIPAKNLYLKMGFNEIGIRKDYYPNFKTRENAIMMAYGFF